MTTHPESLKNLVRKLNADLDMHAVLRRTGSVKLVLDEDGWQARVFVKRGRYRPFEIYGNVQGGPVSAAESLLDSLIYWVDV
jgi:hypothetical protein